MKTLPKDILIKISLDFELHDIINFCLTSKIINERVGLNQMFWMKKLMEFDINNRVDIPEKYRLQDGRFDYKKYYLYIDYILKNYPKYDGYNGLLELGSKEGELNLVKISINKGAKIHENDDRALRHSSDNGHLKVVKFLIKSGAKIHVFDDWPLRWASRKGHINVVRFLIESGANIHARYDEALREASLSRHLEVVKFLIKYGSKFHDVFDNCLDDKPIYSSQYSYKI